MSRFDPSLKAVRRIDGHTVSSRVFAELLKEVTARGAAFRMCAKGMSMYPFIRNGDVVTLVRPKTIKVGDVVAFAHPKDGRLIVHRVTARSGCLLTLKGDFTWTADGRLDEKEILGAVIKVERNGRVIRPAPRLVRKLLALLSRPARIARMRMLFYHLVMKRREFF